MSQNIITVWDVGDTAPVTVQIVNDSGAPAAPINGVAGYFLKPGGVRTAFVLSPTATLGTYEGSLDLDVAGDWFWSASTDGADATIRKLYEEHALYVRPSAVLGGLLESYALTTLGATRAYCLRDETNGAKDTTLAQLINSVSKEVIRHCDRQMFPDTAAAYDFTYDGGTYLDLSPFEARTFTSIVVQPVGASTSPVTLDPTMDYVPEPRMKSREGTYLWLRMPRYANPLAVPGSARIGNMVKVTITGDWGMTTIPPDVEMAVLQTIDWRYKNPAAARSVQTGPTALEAYSPQPDAAMQFPPEAQAILDDFARKSWGS